MAKGGGTTAKTAATKIKAKQLKYSGKAVRPCKYVTKGKTYMVAEFVDSVGTFVKLPGSNLPSPWGEVVKYCTTE